MPLEAASLAAVPSAVVPSVAVHFVAQTTGLRDHSMEVRCSHAHLPEAAAESNHRPSRTERTERQARCPARETDPSAVLPAAPPLRKTFA
jgi:hypothetical protein